MERNDSIGLRVFIRQEEALVLLWDKIESANLFETEIFIKKLAKANEVGMRFSDKKLAEGEFAFDKACNYNDLGQISNSTIVCAINAAKLKLDKDAEYLVTVRYAGIESTKKVLPVGVKPESEKDDIKKNIHMFGWEGKSSRWKKIGAVKTDTGEYAMLVQFSPCPSCGYSGDK